jgi:hypothetical protein
MHLFPDAHSYSRRAINAGIILWQFRSNKSKFLCFKQQGKVVLAHLVLFLLVATTVKAPILITGGRFSFFKRLLAIAKASFQLPVSQV